MAFIVSLLLPGERNFRWLEVALVIVVVLGLCALGCAAPRVQTRGLKPTLFEAARFEVRHPAPRNAAVGRDEGAAFVERTLHEAGFQFGTDGTPGALWGYMRTSFRVVAVAEARPGDIVFFDTLGTGPAPACADRTGIVESVTDGRITFAEARGGRVRWGYADPARPRERRGPHGEVLNSFLRPIRIDDPAGARYFAGEMLCGIARAF
jgi:hypothetical protein